MPRAWLLYLQDVQPVQIGSVSLGYRPVRADASLWRVVLFAERLVSGMLLALLLPILAPAAIVLVLLSKRSPLVAHQRVGQGGQSIWILKLRTMWPGDTGHTARFVERLPLATECFDEPKRALDPRVTSRFAAFCRRYSIDELPQLWQVCSGDLSLVGPRPLIRAELDRFYGSAASELLARKPGLTGLWQIKGRSRLSYAQRRRLDLFLVRNWSLRLYCKIIIATIPRVVAGKDAW
jgi:exopolysaccharide production protein ExoY